MGAWSVPSGTCHRVWRTKAPVVRSCKGTWPLGAFHESFAHPEKTFLLALLLGAFNWTTTHIASRAIEDPVVEVRASQASGNPSQEFVACGSADVSQAEPSQIHSLVITNLSGSKLFRDV